jgi:phosphatidylglycerophosphatase A
LEIKDKIAYALATIFGATETKWAPGTIGSFLALPLCAWPVLMHSAWLHAFLIVAVLAAGIWCVPIADSMLPVVRLPGGKFTHHDHGQITIDEVLGMLVATVPLHFISFGSGWVDYGLALGLFRLFDIFKFGPVAYFDSWTSEWGVMLDDFAAGGLAAGAFWVVNQFWRIFSS